MESLQASFDFEAFFVAHYERIARAVARVVGDPARAEDLALEAFWKLCQNPKAHGDKAAGWLYRTAVRLGLNELRGNKRRRRYEDAAPQGGAPRNPEDAYADREARQQVRLALAAVDERQAELLLLRSSGLSYGEVAAALDLNPASIGTVLARARQALRKEYLKQNGQH
jgi:RNA polymerase sigma-70 factor (ECF subfamily)